MLHDKPPPKLAGVVLAGGQSVRMGQPKALLDIKGQPLIRRLAQSLAAVPVDLIIVVTGHRPQQIQDALACEKVVFAHNPDFAQGEMLSSVKTGAAAVEGQADAFFLNLLDQPLVQAQTLRLLWGHWLDERAPLVIPAHQGKRGHPILIASQCIAAIRSIPANGSLRDFVVQQQPRSRVVEVEDAGILTDVDTPADYEKLLSVWKAHPRPIDLKEAR